MSARISMTLCLAAAGLLAAATPASAATLRAAAAEQRSCDDRLFAPGARGVAHAEYTPGRTGVATVRLTSRRGDWDLAVFDARSGVLHDASASAGARERALAWATRGRRLVAQACRRSGRSSRARLSFAVAPASPAPAAGKASLVRVATPLPGDHERLEALGLDVTHNHGAGWTDVVLYGAGDAALLARNGFPFTVRIAELRSHDRAELELAEARDRLGAGRAVPSGRTDYRTLAQYGEDMKALAAAHPGHVKHVVVGQSLEGRPIEGVEIAADVDREDDGRPVFLVMGLHHAREWPSGEMPMEFAVDLARSHAAGDPRVRALLQQVRVLALPVVNPDGFAVSRLAGALPVADGNSTMTLPLALNDAAAYKRKNCRPPAGDPQARAVPCALRPPFGVDLNRNYGAYWGGVGSSTSLNAQNYRGTAPFSEPESEAIHRLSQRRNIVTVISHHTFWESGIWLRQPGVCMWGAAGCQRPGPGVTDPDVVPDEAGMKALGDAMGDATAWDSDLGWVIGQITGATEDWNYFATGAYGYTPEQRGPNFHPPYATAVEAEYTGAGAAHPRDPNKTPTGGVREALLRAAEHSADERFHSVLEGTAKAGRVLRLTKEFSTPTSLPNLSVADKLDLTLTVPKRGAFSWHVTPSTRPLSTTPESYTLTCETRDGRVLSSQPVTIARGERLALDVSCHPGRAQKGGGRTS